MSAFHRFPDNAHRGIKKIYNANILSLVMAVLMMVVLVELRKGSETAIGFAKFLSVVVLILSWIILVLEIVGVWQAGRDERYFKKARNMLILTIVFSALRTLLDSVLLDLASDVTGLLTSLSIIKAIMRVARHMDRSDMYHLGQQVHRLLLIVNGGSIGLSVIAELVKSEGSFVESVLILILSLAALILALLVTVMCLSYLRRAAEMTDTITPGQSQNAEYYNDAYSKL